MRNVSKDFLASNMKKNGFNSHIYEFTVDYDAVNIDDILDTTDLDNYFHKYLMRKNDIV